MNEITKTEGGALALPEAELLQVLQSSLYPGAASASIRLVLGYCKAAGLDPMQKPVHIVPMWDNKASTMRDVIMPGVNLYRTQAARSGQFAGMSEPEFGPDVEDTLSGVEVTYPEWCRVTVKRLLSSGLVAEFTAREYWIENYAVKGGKEKSIAPNAMWLKRPRGQIAKCTAAQALRIAFPEIVSAVTADEMEGKPMNADATPSDMPAPVPKELRAFAVDAAKGGVEWLRKWWNAQSEADRALLAPEFKALKIAAKQSDAERTVETPPADIDPFVADMVKAEEGGAT